MPTKATPRVPAVVHELPVTMPTSGADGGRGEVEPARADQPDAVVDDGRDGAGHVPGADQGADGEQDEHRAHRGRHAADGRVGDRRDRVAVLEGDQARERRAEQQRDLERPVGGARCRTARSSARAGRSGRRSAAARRAGWAVVGAARSGVRGRHGGLSGPRRRSRGRRATPTSSPWWCSSPRAQASRPTTSTSRQRRRRSSGLRCSSSLPPHSGSRSSGQVMQCPPPRPLPSSKPSIVMTSTPASRIFAIV